MSDTSDGSGLTALPRSHAVLDNMSMTVSLVLVTGVTAATLLRIFTTRELLVPLLLSVVGPMACTFAARLTRIPWIVGLAAAVVVEAAVLAWWIHRTTGLPITASTPRDAAAIMRLAWLTIDDLKPPIAPQLGFALMAMLGTWVVATVADTVAFRLRSPLEALIPSVAMLAVSSALSRHLTGQPRVRSAAVVVGVGMLHVFVVTAADRGRPRAWFGAVRPRRGPALLRGACVAAAAGVVVLFGVPRSNLASLTPSLDLRVERSQSNPRIVTSPLVSMRRQLLALTDDEQFNVRSVSAAGTPARAYWRQTALSDFDGTNWTGSGSFTSIGRVSRLAHAGDDAGGSAITQDVRIEALASTWLPVAYRVTSIDAPELPADAALSFDPATASLITKRVSVQGLRYGAVSNPLSAATARRVLAARAAVHEVSMLALPAGFPVRVRALAIELTAGEPTVVGKARALQDYLRTFRYTTDVPPPSGGDALERFLFTEKAGYCEQFSGAFAAMARAIGLPTRVAVGYTPGRYDPSDGRFHVTGRNAHAWPEVDIEGTGWVAFEPTPGRGIPGSEAVTGVPDQDASEGVLPGAAQSPAPVTAPTIAPATATVAPPQSAVTTAVPAAPPTPAGAGGGLGRTLLFATVGALMAVAVACRRQVLDAWRDARAQAGGPELLVERSWARSVRAAGWAGIRTDPVETPVVFAHRLERLVPGADPVETVAELVTAARYGRSGTVSDEDATAAMAASRQWEAAAFAVLPRWRRALHFAGLPSLHRL